MEITREDYLAYIRNLDDFNEYEPLTFEPVEKGAGFFCPRRIPEDAGPDKLYQSILSIFGLESNQVAWEIRKEKYGLEDSLKGQELTDWMTIGLLGKAKIKAYKGCDADNTANRVALVGEYRHQGYIALLLHNGEVISESFESFQEGVTWCDNKLDALL